MSHRSVALLALLLVGSVAQAATTYILKPLPSRDHRDGCLPHGSTLSPTSGLVVGTSCAHGDGRVAATIWNARHERALPLPDTGAPSPWAVNDAGEAVGDSYDGVGPAAIAWTRAGRIHALPGLTMGDFTQAVGISAAGDIAGYEIHSPDNRLIPITWHRGVPRALPLPPGQVDAYPMAMSANGTMAGFAFDANQSTHAALWSNGEATILGPASAAAFGVNDSGQVVGWYYNGHTVPFSAVGDVFTPLPPLPSHPMGVALAVNSDGVVVGRSGCGCGDPETAVRWVQGQVEDLNTLMDPASVPAGWTVISATSIDDLGRIAATARLPTGESAGVVLVPSAP